MSLGTFSDLKAAIIDELDRDDLSGKVDQFIQLAEARHKRDIRIREMIVRAQAQFLDRYLALPAGFLQMDTLRLLTNPVTVLTQVSLHEMNRRIEATGRPQLFTIHEEIEFDRAPSAVTTAEMIYYAAFTPLDDANPVNALLTRAPDAYFYGALVASSPWLSEDERIATWSGLYDGAVAALTQTDRRSRHGGALVSRVSGPTP